VHVSADRRLERLPVLIFSVLGLVLVVGVLAATSSTEEQDPPSWYPPSGAVVAPAVDTSSPTTTTGPRISVGQDRSRTEREPTTTPTSEESPPAQTGGSEEAAAPGWRLVATLPAHRGALSGLELVTGGGTETFVAAGADQHGPLVLAASEADAWRALPRAGLPPDGYARAVAATQDAVVVAGADPTGPAVWELAGDSWRRAPVAGAGEGRVVFADLAVRKGTWVLVGFDGANTGFWVRPPGSERFAAVPTGAVTGPAAEQMLVREVVATDAGFVAVGQAGGRAVRWSSIDGIDWSGESLVAGEGATAVGVTADGGTIVGYDGAGGVIWVDRQGQRTLVRLPAPSGAPQTAERVASRSGHTVVFGLEAGAVRCWETDDDARPPERCADSTALDSASSVGAVVAHRDGLLGVGQVHPAGSEAGQVGVWALAVE
jgi:hypothetical protein